jgi:hypothetical protein
MMNLSFEDVERAIRQHGEKAHERLTMQLDENMSTSVGSTSKKEPSASTSSTPRIAERNAFEIFQKKSAKHSLTIFVRDRTTLPNEN